MTDIATSRSAAPGVTTGSSDTGNRISKKSSAVSQERNVRKTYRWVNDANASQKDGQKVRLCGTTLESPQMSPIVSRDSSSVHASSDSSDNILSLVRKPPLCLAPSEVLHPQARMLYEYCKWCPSGQYLCLTATVAQNVAPVMVVLDTESNGYRDIILPMACQDMLLARAVSVTATFHLAQQTPELRQTAEAGHLAIIEKLRRDSINNPDQVFNQYTLATILVLLVGETITAADNYSYLLEMLECFTKALDSIILPAGLKDFFKQQIKMYGYQCKGFTNANTILGFSYLAFRYRTKKEAFG